LQGLALFLRLLIKRGFFMLNDDLVATIYGYETYKSSDGLVTEMGIITILHLDSPDTETIKLRINEAIKEEDECLDEGCYLCQSIKGKPYTLVYTKECD
jgi:hypothetical protein